MRPIKFRGQRINSNIWVYGYYRQAVQHEETVVLIHDIDTGFDHPDLLKSEVVE